MLHTNFIVSTLFYWNQPFKQQPLTQLYLCTIVDEKFQRNGVDIQITDLRGLNKNKLSSYVHESDVYFYSIASPDYAEVKLLVEDLRKKYPSAKHIAGGAHVNIFPQHSSKFFDAIVLKNGEKSIVQVIEDIQNNKLKKVYEIDPQYDSEKYPFPKRNYLPKEKIITRNFMKCMLGVVGTSTLFSHGCPFCCNFCANYNRHKCIRRTNKEIEAEINYLKKEYDVKGLGMLDEICIPLDEKEAVPYLEMMGNLNVVWRGQSRIGIKPEILKLAKKAGCLELNIGVESVSRKVIDIMKKGIRLEGVKKMIKDCKNAEIKIYINLVNGLPGEPKNIAQMNKDFIEETKPDLVNLFSLCLYPGSPIYENPEKYGINPKSINHDYSKLNHLVRRFKGTNDNLEDLILFEYYPKGHWGETLTRQEILNNLNELQDYIISKGLNK